MRGTGPCLEVLDPGLLASVQDAGRPGLGALGITRGGAADPEALAAANLLLGNDPGAAAIELTLPGARLRALRATTVALAGADLGARVDGTGAVVPPGTTVRLAAGQELAFTGSAGADPATSPASAPRRRADCRACLAVPGGLDVPVVLGGRGTALGAGFGGLEGRALRAGDRLSAAPPAVGAADDPAFGHAARWPAPLPSLVDGPLRVLSGPHADLLGPGALAALCERAWTVAPASDRIGVRLDGEALPGARPVDLASHGVIAGTIQVPADGRPIVLLADHQPTGGYPVLAIVIAADRAALGQLAPGDRVAFTQVDEAAARAAAQRRRADHAEALAALHEAAAWDALWRGAGG